MSFSFGFTGNDLEDDELDGSNSVTNIVTDATIVNPLDEPRLLADETFQPTLENLQLILESLSGVRLTFEEFQTPLTNTTLYRRELFDIKHQLMSEDLENDSATDKTELEILIGGTSEDVRKNVYEGGLKSWECSIDLVDALVDLKARYCTLSNYDTILELGCGTSLPTEYIFKNHLQENEDKGLNLILSDYNKSVLRLVTVPNLIITWAKTVLDTVQWNDLQTKSSPDMPVRDDELMLTPELLTLFLSDLKNRNITVNIISGTWSRRFDELTKSVISPNAKNIMMLTSETIYQPENLTIVAETIIDLKTYYQQNAINLTCLLAAKDIYFGVGGSIVEFENYLTKQIELQNLNIVHKTFKIDAGLKRSIMHIE
ncbi:hypothetical protein TPHA_0F01200 [Tetrapisispora phaffii CBS 4417]|uniref:Histidine protein methyltransferase 1 n=1 Tax=Tetrapisispora phaffii (strain ATCC 24235 / CBS 4417 / NBRC 1672 / NRRL Y-8282 / UCD 70-5) TaxID=1071381 RepID=G8BV23_TETPH|nr:hypothetical protein TPHA_0F01200 [Tetrapisispora phaffii CBS 4417]CCE63605.1 hypothetical protein TPHA_0F01200 [Tetrapisispora phaffii CBS 4417]